MIGLNFINWHVDCCAVYSEQRIAIWLGLDYRISHYLLAIEQV